MGPLNKMLEYADSKRRKLESMEEFGMQPTWADRALPNVNMYEDSPSVIDPGNAGVFGYGTRDNMEMTPQQLYERQETHPYHQGAQPEVGGFGLGALLRRMRKPERGA